jgi:signal transduction histidine kinase
MIRFWKGGPSSRPAAPTLLRVYLMVGTALLAVAFLLYFQSLTRRVDEETDLMSELFAQFVVVAATMVSDDPESAEGASKYRDVMRRVNFPIILSDPRGVPMVWNESQIKVPLVEEIDQILNMHPDSLSEPIARVKALQDELDREHPPIRLTRPGSTVLLGHVHYGTPSLSNELKWVPWLTIGVATLFGITALAGLRSIKRSEQSFVWAGLAKESAHQMGTPISSLLGWAELLRDRASDQSDPVEVPRAFYDEITTEIERDAQRLNRVAARFSQIGSAPQLKLGSVEPVVTQTVEYFERRLPTAAPIAMKLELDPSLPDVRFNKELLGWVLENLIKNAVNAIEKGGVVSLAVGSGQDDRGVRIKVRDTGRGIPSRLEKEIFRPGVSTRPRGWGLGLALSRRIMVDYHGGKLDLTWTREGEGAEFTITLPPAKEI